MYKERPKSQAYSYMIGNRFPTKKFLEHEIKI